VAERFNGFTQKIILVILGFGIPSGLGSIWWAGRTSARAEVIQEQLARDIEDNEGDIQKLLEVSQEQSKSITELKTIQDQHLRARHGHDR